MTERQPHADLDNKRRLDKAQKISRLLDLQALNSAGRMLEVGTGSGHISHFFGTHESLDVRVTSVDVIDLRTVKEGYEFQLVGGTDLPFADGYFDLVISNHVIEHVGTGKDQLAHLSEMRRVLSSDGFGYLATPNRWAVIEPHYRLAFLSWLPGAMRSKYLRLMRRGEYYDCEPLSLRRLHGLLTEAGLVWSHLEHQAIAHELSVKTAGLASAVESLPAQAVESLLGLMPSFVCRFEHPAKGLSG